MTLLSLTLAVTATGAADDKAVIQIKNKAKDDGATTFTSAWDESEEIEVGQRRRRPGGDPVASARRYGGG